MLGAPRPAACPPTGSRTGTLLPDIFQVDRDSLEAMRDAVAYHGPERIAAIMAEPVIGAGGVFPPAEGYLQGLRELCDECGALLMFDEVITGFGRLGSWFASHHFGVTPDMMTFAKAVTSGYLPLGGVVVGPTGARVARGRSGLPAGARQNLRRPPQCCAAGVANLELMRAEELPERAAAAGRAVACRAATASRSRGVAEVRGEGLMQAVAFEQAVAPRERSPRQCSRAG